MDDQDVIRNPIFPFPSRVFQPQLSAPYDPGRMRGSPRHVMGVGLLWTWTSLPLYYLTYLLSCFLACVVCKVGFYVIRLYMKSRSPERSPGWRRIAEFQLTSLGHLAHRSNYTLEDRYINPYS
ncbi:hypothetical protein BJX61DRAFT_183375 [Aspergillus egyptiacus]|nr:hypothetical protein BJX61DRAFT_183375 [Aspergillus egyptiacus]